MPFLNLAPKAVIKGVLARHTVTMVTYCVAKMITTYSSMAGQFFDIVTVEPNDKEWL